jgi:DNA-directed RNA polymerase alpha subunit
MNQIVAIENVLYYNNKVISPNLLKSKINILSFIELTLDHRRYMESVFDKMHIEDVGELIVCKEADFLSMRGFGESRLKDLKSYLKSLGLSLNVEIHKSAIEYLYESDKPKENI